jgi:hydrogenase expression/formation protein HypC
MCLALPARIEEIHDGGANATVALGNVKKRISLALIEDAAVGEYVLIHVGYALHKISEEEAARTLELMSEAEIALAAQELATQELAAQEATEAEVA